MHRFYSKTPPRATETIKGDLYHQLAHVFRGKVGDQFTLFTEGSSDFIYEIQEIKKDHLKATQTGTLEKNTAKQMTITIFHAFPNKINTMELIVEKLTELGISRVVFFSSSRSQLSEISENKKERIERIATEALEQCGGNNPLVIEYSSGSIEEILKTEKKLQHIVASQNKEKNLEISNLQNVGLWIGPEGGWTDEEQAFFNMKQLTQWSFAHQILRLETAGIVGAGILSYLAQTN